MAVKETATAEAIITVGDNKKAPKGRKLSSNKKKLIGLAVLVLVVGIGVAGAIMYHRHSIKLAEQASAKHAANAVQFPAAKQQVESASAALAKAKTDEDKSNALLDRASTENANGDPNGALQDALAADDIDHSAGTSSFVAGIYQEMGNKLQAASYYNKAANEVKPVQGVGHDKQYYLNQAQQVVK